MPRQKTSANHHRGILKNKSLTTSTRQPSPRHLPTQGPASHHRGICQDKNLSTSTCMPSPRKLPRQKPYHKLLRTITAAFAKTENLLQAPANHHHSICQNKPLPQAHEPSPRHLPRQRPHCTHLLLITAAFAKTKTSTSTCEPSPWPLPGQEPYHKHPRTITTALPRREPYHKLLRNITVAFAKTKTSTSNCEPSTRHLPRQLKRKPHAPANHHRGICQDKNLTTSTREPSPRHLPRRNPYHQHPQTITAAFARNKTLPQSPASHHHGICQHKDLRSFIAAFAKTDPLP